MIIGVFSCFSSLLWAGIIPVESGTGRDARKSLDKGIKEGPRTWMSQDYLHKTNHSLTSTRLQVCDRRSKRPEAGKKKEKG